jgi:hypothetical protein
VFRGYVQQRSWLLKSESWRTWNLMTDGSAVVKVKRQRYVGNRRVGGSE